MTILLCLLLVIALAGALWFYLKHNRTLGELARIREEREAIVVEEHRLFDFLHGLGVALAEDQSLKNLHRVISEGVIEVSSARGGAFYQYHESKGQLVPTFYSRDCPPVVALPERIVEQSKANSKTLGSFLRLHAVNEGEGLIGKIFQSGDPQRVADLRAHPDFDGGPNPFQKGIMAMVAPLTYCGKGLGVLLVTRLAEDGAFSDNDFDVFSAVAEQSAFALGNAIIHEEASEKRRMEAELHNASEIQRVLLPSEAPELADYLFAATSLPAKMVSGDYYDYVPIDRDHFGVVIGDVSGKGIPASLIAAMCRSVLRAEAVGNHSPAKVLGSVNRLIFPDIREDMFVSAIYLVLDRQSRTVTMARAGHSGALHYRKASGEIANHEPPGLAVGIDRGGVFERVTQDFDFEMEAGDIVLLYTDGVTEALDSKGLEYGDARLIKVFLETAANGGADEVVRRLEEDLDSFYGTFGKSDDITLIAIEKRED